MPEIQLPTKKTQDEIKAKVDSINTSMATVGKRLRSKVYTTGGNFIVPAGVTEVYLTGGGGGGAGGESGGAGAAQSGGITSFGGFLSLSGGGGGSYGEGGAAGGPGGSQGGMSLITSPTNVPGFGGGSGFYPMTPQSANGAYCCGGGADSASYSGGGGGDFVIDFPVSVTPNTHIPINIGHGGISFRAAGNGGRGILTVKWWE